MPQREALPKIYEGNSTPDGAFITQIDAAGCSARLIGRPAEATASKKYERAHLNGRRERRLPDAACCAAAERSAIHRRRVSNALGGSDSMEQGLCAEVSWRAVLHKDIRRVVTRRHQRVETPPRGRAVLGRFVLGFRRRGRPVDDVGLAAQ